VTARPGVGRWPHAAHLPDERHQDGRGAPHDGQERRQGGRGCPSGHSTANRPTRPGMTRPQAAPATAATVTTTAVDTGAW
jgi:hypothetical protein